MKKFLLSFSLMLALSSSPLAFAATDYSVNETTAIWEAVRQSQMTVTLTSGSSLGTAEPFKGFLAASPEQSVFIRGFQLTAKSDGTALDLEFSKPHLEKLQQQLPTVATEMNLPAAARATTVLKTLEPLKTNTNADIIHLKKLLLDANVPSRYRVSELGGKLHYSLIANVDGIQYNIDLANWMVPDSVMKQLGCQFKYDNWHLDAPPELKPQVQNHKSTFTYFAQTNSAWKLTKFSYSNVARTGCGPLSATMIFNYLTPDHIQVTPQSVIKLSKDQNLDIVATPRVHMPKLLTQLSQLYGVNFKTLKTFDERYLPDSRLGEKVASDHIKAQVASEIKAGKMVLVATLLNSELHYTNGTEHFLVVKDFIGGKAIVYDPMPNHTSYEPLPSALQNKYGGYCYQVPVEVLLKRMTQAYSFEQ